MKTAQIHSRACTHDSGTTLIELLVVLVIFSIVMAGLYSGYSVLSRQGVGQYKLAQSEMEFQIAKSVIERDIAMAGSGIAEHYCLSDAMTTVGTNVCVSGWQCTDGSGLCVPVYVRGNSSFTTLPNFTMMGVELSRSQRAAQAWSITNSNNPDTTASYPTWTDQREQLRTGDKMFFMDPNTKTLMKTDPTSPPNSLTHKSWLFLFPSTSPGSAGSPLPPMGDIEGGYLAFGMANPTTASPNVPYYVVDYSLSQYNLPQSCALGTGNLLRRESSGQASGSDVPAGIGQPLMNCVLDFQVALGLATNVANNDQSIKCWDLNGAQCAANYTNETLRQQLKQVKVFILVQEGNKDSSFTYSGTNPISMVDPPLPLCYAAPTCVPSAGLVSVPTHTITGDLLHYRWKMLTLDVSPRNIR